MTVLRIPVRSDVPFFVQRTAIEGRDYLLRFRWNQRSAEWFFDLLDQDESAIVSGVKVVTDVPLLRRVIDSRRPPGEIYAYDRTGGGLPPTLSDFGSRVTLLYVPAGDQP